MSRISPRISVSKLAEYLVATPRRRRRIILDAIDPPDFKVAPHRRARSAILRSSRRGWVDEAKLAACAARLRKIEPKSKWDRDDLENSIAAIERFGLVFPRLDLGLTILRPRSRSALLHVEGVNISVTPSLLVRGGTVAKPTVGAVKLYLVKTNPLTNKAGDYTATILRSFLNSRFGGSGFTVDPALCQVVDIFADRVFVAPEAYKRRMEDVAVACDSIRRLWDSYLADRRDRRGLDQLYPVT